MLMNAAECQRFIETRDPAAIAACLRRDQELCKSGRLPSPLALHLPNSSCALADAISRHLLPQDGVPRAVRALQYDGIIRGIKAYLNQMDQVRKSVPQDNAVESGRADIPTNEEFQATLKVLDYLRKHEPISRITPSSPLTDVLTAVRSQLSLDSDLQSEYKSLSSAKLGSQRGIRKCYICRLQIRDEPHDLYPALCRPCGTFNLSRSELSLPGKLDLSGKTALVTGGRINLGFHTARRLLRCGASVIVSSRYPRDAETRYAHEHDFHDWAPRLRIVGADFRTAKDAFRLVRVVKQVLTEWSTTPDGAPTLALLDILINNAAQTLTDPITSEVKAIAREGRLQKQLENSVLLVDYDQGYEPKVRGGVQAPWVAGIEGKIRLQVESREDIDDQQKEVIRKGLGTDDDTEKDGKSSWLQTLHEIPYEDMISTHSVNAFVPLILCRELLGHMGSAKSSSNNEDVQPETSSTSKRSSRPLGYIINVSSREGILEDRKNSRMKEGHHVHTNMSKAAINMITETEATRAWNNRCVAMNTVDPGYMSAAPEHQTEEGCPIGFEDGAARVLWPIAVGVQDGTPVWGRFLKHFGEVDAQIVRGR
ncbi:hypothetical protein VTN00DRAFT_6810 [Thermoascus crustaceus]|uniref:uncharacterized protein n=1 Tax=Thermoascus crustaceus TaxID=5088 RepID=UPI0037445EE3